MNDTKLSNCLFVDLETDEQRRDWFLLGRGVATGIIAPALQPHLANAYSKIVESRKLIEQQQQRIEELEAQVPRWISVEDELPEHHNLYSEWVLGKNNKFSYPKVVRIIQCGGDRVWQDTSGACVVVHKWIPLPQSPKEQSK